MMGLSCSVENGGPAGARCR